MPYTLLYHPKVREEDIPALNRRMQQRIYKAIETRLTTEPEKYGRPLKGTLKGYWKLRVGDYRVVYKIVESDVLILGILHRKEIYGNMTKRLKWQSQRQKK